MARAAIFLAVLVGALVVSVLPDYIGLSFGFWSFLDHADLTHNETRQFGWLAAYCVAMAALLIGMSTAVLLSFIRLAPQVLWGGSVAAAIVVVLAGAHVSGIYLGADGISQKTLELFVRPAERHAWTSLVAALLTLLGIQLRRRIKSSPRAP